jgi:hypothetical protein
LFARHGFIHDVDFDITFLTPWAMRFRKNREPLSRVVAAYERKLWRLEQENYASRTLVIEQREQLTQQARAVITARAAQSQALEEAQSVLAAARTDQERRNELRALCEVVDQKMRQMRAFFYNLPATREPRFRPEALLFLQPLRHPVEWVTKSLRDVEVLGSGESLLWHLKGPGAEVIVQISIPPGRYYFHGRAVADVPGRLRLDVGDSGPASVVRLGTRAKEFCVPLDLTSPAQGLTLTWSGKVCWLADFQLLRDEPEPILHTIKRNVRSQLRNYPRLHRMARQIKKVIKRLNGERPDSEASPTVSVRPEVIAAGAVAPSGRTWTTPGDDPEAYRRWMESRQAERQANCRVPSTPGLFSILTTVWNTPIAYLNALTASLFTQKHYPDFEWVVLDNGSTDSETRSWIAGLSGYAQARVFRVEDNLGIAGGMRYCLERATGRYVLPVDSDDLLYPDALKVLAWYVRNHNYPPLLYSDEDKVQDGRHRDAYLKPSWDPVLFMNSAYIAHLGAIDRALALQLGAYSDSEANGCHDWDTFLRFMLAGYQPVHVPEVLYSWRMHQGSCAGNIDSKSYIHSSHKRVLNKFLAAHPQGQRYRVESSPLFHGTPDWWFHREHTNPRPLLTLVLSRHGEEVDPRPWREGATYPVHEVRPLMLEGGVEELYHLAEAVVQDHGLIQLAAAGMKVEGSEWPWEVLALTELHPDVVMVGGRVLDGGGAVVTAGEVLGFGGSCGCPDESRPENDCGYHAQMWKQRSVSAVSSLLAVVDAAFLAEFLRRHRSPRMSLRFLGAWMGAYAWRTGKRVVYTPHMTGRLATNPEWYAQVPQEEKDALTAGLRDLLPDTRYLSRHLSLNPAAPYRLASQAEQKAVLPHLLARSA